MDSLGILEQGYLFPSPSAIVGVKADCPFCIARHITEYRSNDVGLMLQARDAGRLLSYRSSTTCSPVDEFEWVDEPGLRSRLLRDHCLTLPIEVLTVPFWLPELSLRNCFVIDEISVWFCNESAAGEGFHWQDERMIEVVRTLWRRRIPVQPAELSKVFLAHGMPSYYQTKAERLFEFGISTLTATHGRPALKKFRLEQSASQVLYNIWKLK